MQLIKEVRMVPEEVMTSYNVKSLFISVLADSSINTVKQKLQTGPTTLTKDQHVHTTNNNTPGNLPQKTYFPFQGKYYKQVHGAAMDFPLAQSLPTCSVKRSNWGPYLCPTSPQYMAKVLGWHICSPGGKTQSTITTTQLTGPTYTVHCRGTKPKRSPTFPGHFGFSRSWQNPSHYSLQVTYTHWPIHTLGQQPFHHSHK